MEQSEQRRECMIALKSVPHDVPEVFWLRHLLKLILRGFGFKVVSVKHASDELGARCQVKNACASPTNLEDVPRSARSYAVLPPAS